MNLGILALGIACLGVAIGEGFMIGNMMKSAARQPELLGKLQPLMFLGIAFMEGTFFVTLAMAFVLG
ncbi:F-type H+-transporting ATPase subunit c [Streptococcus henryi]|jgi:F-type H+-transporting ATPase subunit c|uniref:ATP synthase subunit c n=2 Tax=Streptococcus henryi TaxID=439219 RepID=A0A1G6AVR6_9STRE|nr:F-type H+-transporting ATPase subunit c [Streptococcus henryi]